MFHVIFNSASNEAWFGCDARSKENKHMCLVSVGCAIII